MKKKRILKLAKLLRSVEVTGNFCMSEYYTIEKDFPCKTRGLSSIVRKFSYRKFMSPNSCGCIAGYATALYVARRKGKTLREITYKDIGDKVGEERIEKIAQDYLQITDKDATELFHHYAITSMSSRDNFTAARCLEILVEEGHVDWKKAYRETGQEEASCTQETTR